MWRRHSNIGVNATSPATTGTIFAYRDGYASNGGLITVDDENLNGRMIPSYAGITTTLAAAVTNTTTEHDVKMLKDKGLIWLVTTTPRLEGRSFGTNVIEAFFFGVKESNKLTQTDYETLSKELDFSGNIERLNK